MGIICELTGKRPQVGNNVSHSNRKTKRRFIPNIQQFCLFSKKLNKKLKVKIAISTLRAIEKKGGIDEFLLSMDNRNLASKGLYFKKQII